MDKLGFFNGSNVHYALLKVNWATYRNSGAHLAHMMYLSLAIPCGVGGTLDPPIPRVPRQQRGLIGKDLAEGLNLPPLEGQLMEQ